MKKLSILLLLLLFFQSAGEALAKTPSEKTLNSSITRAEKYYEGLYVDLGNNQAVVNEYYSSPSHTYTVRHGVAGGIYYYDYIGDATRSAKLRNFAIAHGYDVSRDLHSFVWGTTFASKENIYSIEPYQDCFTNLPTVGNEIPYHSKVCKLGIGGIGAYVFATEQDTLLPIIGQLQSYENTGKVNKVVLENLEHNYNKLGFGMPICMFSYCENIASTIRTAEFGDLELRLHKMNYADEVAAELIKAQNNQGAVYFSFDKDGNLKDRKSFLYNLIEKILGDKSIYKGFIPTNAETMNDVLAFLLHYRCVKYHVCK